MPGPVARLMACARCTVRTGADIAPEPASFPCAQSTKTVAAVLVPSVLARAPA